ncbi:MAG: biotin synthase BioB [Deltaproteobacteria bacterium]|jgi:biotin synthase|nr:biotin synthase BioB [Deltaproteobacteria bacterium]
MIKASLAAELTEQVLAGKPPSREQGVAILMSRGAQYTAYMAGAHGLKEKAFDSNIRLCSIINAKSGRCQENCAFCAQSAHFATQSPTFPLKSLDEILLGAKQAAAEGSHCFGIVTSGSKPKDGEEFQRILHAIRDIRSQYSIAPSASLGMLTDDQAQALADAGCVTYHHNLETARSYFPEICTTHSYDQDIQTVISAKKAGMKVCCGGIFGLGESIAQRVEFAETLQQLDVDSVPLNFLSPIPGTPLEGRSELKPMDCLRIITLFRFFLPGKPISVCGGREHNLRDLQAMMFMAGASGTMIGNYLTTTGRSKERDLQMFDDLEVQIDDCV